MSCKPQMQIQKITKTTPPPPFRGVFLSHPAPIRIINDVIYLPPPFRVKILRYQKTKQKLLKTPAQRSCAESLSGMLGGKTE